MPGLSPCRDLDERCAELYQVEALKPNLPSERSCQDLTRGKFVSAVMCPSWPSESTAGRISSERL